MPKQARKPWGSLCREAIVEAALEIVDSEGMEALSMPRLAGHLGTGVMTLYGHIANKADLLGGDGSDASVQEAKAKLAKLEDVVRSELHDAPSFPDRTVHTLNGFPRPGLPVSKMATLDAELAEVRATPIIPSRSSMPAPEITCADVHDLPPSVDRRRRLS